MNPTRAVLRNPLQPPLRSFLAGFVASSGPELVVNGGFADGTGWTVGAEWVIADAKASKTSAGTSLLQQAIGISVGAPYVVTFTILETTTEGAGMSFFLGQTSGTVRTTPGTYTETVTPGLGNVLYFIARGVSGDWTGSIDNVSVRASII